MKIIKFWIWLLIGVLLSRMPVVSMAASVSKSGGVISSVKRLDLSTGKVVGEKVNYEMEIPAAWSTYMLMDRENLDPGGRILEKINVYYLPINKISKPEFIVSLFIFDKKYWDEGIRYKKLIETDNCVFALYVGATDNPFVYKADKILYAYFLGEAGDVEFFKNIIKLPDGHTIVPEESVVVNGKDIGVEIIFKDGKSPYVPLRQVCEALGYSVNWRQIDNSVTVSRDDFKYTLFTEPKGRVHNFGMMLVSEQNYISTMFFTQILRINIEVDERDNVYITELY